MTVFINCGRLVVIKQCNRELYGRTIYVAIVSLYVSKVL